ncbi:MAG: hypothetical protein AAB693_01355 [Patescibacteria group bacterium]
MVNKELLTYISQQLKEGLSQEKITNNLLANNWEAQDIKEGFEVMNVHNKFSVGDSTNIQIKKANNIWRVAFIFLTILLIISGGSYFVYQKFYKPKNEITLPKEPIKSSQEEVLIKPLEPIMPTESIKKTPENLVVKETIVKPSVSDCGKTLNFEKFDCFTEAIKDCRLAKVINSIQLDLFGSGFATEAISLYELRGLKTGKCEFYIKTISSKVYVTPEAVKEFLKQGITREQIKLREQKLSKEAAQSDSSTIGKDAICLTDIKSLLDLFGKWQKGVSSNDDLANINCKGKLAEAMEPKIIYPKSNVFE